MFRKLADLIDTVLAWLKWPMAVLCILLFLPAISHVSQILIALVGNAGLVLPFIGGAAIYGVLWFWFIRGWRVTFLSTLEHEITHAIFAWLTFHRVVGLKSTWKSGGHVVYKGKGNWLITVAPYFVPTICLVFILLFTWVTVFSHQVQSALIGAAFAYHVTSTWRETHRGQSDLQQTGFVWCFCFLPTANLVVNGMVLAHALGGNSGITSFLGSIWKSLRAMTG